MTDDSTYEFSTDPDRIDAARVHELIVDTYWGPGRSREMMDAATAGSRPYGVYRRDTGAQVAFARVVTDGVTFAWLSDVVVDPSLRGQGIGKLLIGGVIADLEPLGLRRTLLATADAQSLYEQFGWVRVDPQYTWMELPGTGAGPRFGVSAGTPTSTTPGPQAGPLGAPA
ncbi:GNAT family N-acetyltransferase [Promicromonospora sp. NPDC060271]|uniref:GNAT family N-acetyltransferase n=1 Tax=Promicromonospora sp. NPDC060271 TaxID=3347089 RepID=UPI003669BDF3